MVRNRKNFLRLCIIINVLLFYIIIGLPINLGAETNKLETPTDLTIDDEYNASWTAQEETDHFWLTFTINGYEYYSFGQLVALNETSSYSYGSIKDGVFSGNIEIAISQFYKNMIETNKIEMGQIVELKYRVKACAKSGTNYTDSVESSWSESFYYSKSDYIKLETPTDLTIDDEYNASWTAQEETDHFWLTFTINGYEYYSFGQLVALNETSGYSYGSIKDGVFSGNIEIAISKFYQKMIEIGKIEDGDIVELKYKVEPINNAPGYIESNRSSFSKEFYYCGENSQNIKDYLVELATIDKIEGIQVYNKNQFISNKTIDDDIYIAPNTYVNFYDVTINGDIYVLGTLSFQNRVTAKTIHTVSMEKFDFDAERKNGLYLKGDSNVVSSIEYSDYPVTNIPYSLNRSSIKTENGKLHINGVTLDIADFYINDTKIDIVVGGKFIADNIDLGGSNIITLKWVTVFGNTITKTYCIEDIVGDVNFDGKVNITDVALINAHVKKTKTLTGDELERADVNEDGKVNITDVALVNAHVKKVKPLPTPKTDKEKAEEVINKYLNNGAFEANAIRPNANNQAEIETFYYSSIYDDFIDLDELKNDLSNQNMSLQFSHDNIPSDYSSFTIKVYKTENGQTTDEITEMTIPINYKTVDPNVLDKSETLIQKIKTNGVIPEGWDVDEYYGFYLEDLDLVDYYTSCGITKDTVRTKEQTGKSLNYLDCLATNDNEMSYYLDAREGDDYLLNEDYGGFANVLYNGIKVGAIDLVGVIEKNVIHIPAETENTKEAYIEAATQKLKERFGDNVSVTEGGLRNSLDLSSAIESGWSWNRLGDESLMGDYYYNVTVNGYTNQFVIVKEASEPADPSELIKTENVIITKSDKSSEEIENMYPNACSTLPENYEEVLILGIPKFLDVEGNEIEPIGGEGETGVQLYEIDNTRDYTGCTMIITFTKYVGETVDMPDFGTLTYKDSTSDQWYTYYNYQVSITSNDFKKNDGEWTYYEIQQTNIETNDTYTNHLFFKFRGEIQGKTDKEKAEEIINKYLNNGTLDANAIAPDGNKQEEVEIFYYKSIEDDFLNKEEMKNELNNENMTLQLSYDNVPSDYSSFIVKVYKVENNLPTDLITEITIPINYKTVDQNKIAYANAAISKIDAFKVDLGQSLYGYKLADLDLVDYYTSCGITKDIDRTQDQYGEALNYIPDTKMGAEDMTFYFDVREGDAFAINEDYGGFAIILNNGIKIGACQTFVVENNIIYIPDETENTSEAYMEAATKRLKERFGDDVNISEAGLISDFADIQEPLAEGWIDLGDESLRGDYYYNVTVNGYTNYFVIMRDSSKINN